MPWGWCNGKVDVVVEMEVVGLEKVDVDVVVVMARKSY